MYVPKQFEETRIDVLHQLMQAHPLGALITLDAEGFNANHLPFEIAPATADAPNGTLRAHIARSNPLWCDAPQELETLVIFQGAQSYITPSWYAEKMESGKVVPTYNYAVVHAYGPLRIIDDSVWLRAFLERLTNSHEAGRAQPWQVSDAPDDYIRKTMAGIVGIEIPLSRMIGKWKTSQNRPDADRRNIVTGLREMAGENASAMAEMIKL